MTIRVGVTLDADKFTFQTSFPNRVSVLKPGYNVILDLERESQAVSTTFFQRKPQAFGVSIFRNRKNNFWSVWGED